MPSWTQRKFLAVTQIQDQQPQGSHVSSSSDYLALSCSIRMNFYSLCERHVVELACFVLLVHKRKYREVESTPPLSSSGALDGMGDPAEQNSWLCREAHLPLLSFDPVHAPALRLS